MGRGLRTVAPRRMLAHGGMAPVTARQVAHKQAESRRWQWHVVVGDGVVVAR